MLKHTFCHLPGIGEKTERRIWSLGVEDWESALGLKAGLLPGNLRDLLRHHLEKSLEHYNQGNAAYFSAFLDPSEQWRLFRDFQHSCAFLDIETTGLMANDRITTIALYDGKTIRTYVNGVNLDDFPAAVEKYKVLVTYNGKLFDLPKIESAFSIKLRAAHIDLRYPLYRLGIKGGLKKCEKQLGLTRPGLEDVNGYTAVLLWNEFQRTGSRKALDTLLAYNIQDTVGLHVLLVEVFNRKLKQTPGEGRCVIPAPVLPANPYSPDRATLEKIGAVQSEFPRFDLSSARIS